MEKWKAIPGFEGFYEASNRGRIRSLDRFVKHPSGSKKKLKGRVLKASPMSGLDGYLVVTLSRRGKLKQSTVHSLVLKAFRGPCPEGMESRHFPDRDKQNNRLKNLHWATKKENNQDKKIHGTNGEGEQNGNSKLTNKQRKRIVELKDVLSWNELCSLFRISACTLGIILRKNKE